MIVPRLHPSAIFYDAPGKPADAGDFLRVTGLEASVSRGGPRRYGAPNRKRADAHLTEHREIFWRALEGGLQDVAGTGIVLIRRPIDAAPA